MLKKEWIFIKQSRNKALRAQVLKASSISGLYNIDRMDVRFQFNITQRSNNCRYLPLTTPEMIEKDV